MKKYSLLLLILVVIFTLTSCKHKHDYVDKFVAPLCDEQGYMLHTCDCGDEYKDNYIDALGHEFGDWKVVREATEDTEGLEERVCACGDKEERPIAKLEHKHVYSKEVVAPTCLEQGYTINTCKCNDSYIDSYVKATGHKFSAWQEVKKATVDEEGLKERTCHCGFKEEQVIPKLKPVITYQIQFVTNNENAIWPERSADSRNEIVDELYKDLYEWAVSNGEVKSFEDYVKYIKEQIASYEDINLRNPNLGDAPCEDGCTTYFLNVPKYYSKWAEFFRVFNKAMLNVSQAESFYTDTYTAMVRLYQFTNWTSEGLSYFRSYVSEMKKAAKIKVVVPTSYNQGDSFSLPNVALESGIEFLGWYDNPEFEGYPVVEILSSDEGDKVFYARWDDQVRPVEIEINKISELLLFNTHQLAWAISPENVTDKTLQFTSSDPNIASVSSNGLITTHRNGKVIITVKVVANRDLDVKFTLTVYTNDYVNGYYVDESYLYIGNSAQLFAEVVKKDTTRSNVIWTSLNEEIATVDESGLVTGHNAGIAKIVAQDPNNESLSLEFVVTVLDGEVEGIIDLALRAHESNPFVRYNLGIGAGNTAYYKDILGSVSKLLGNSPLVKNDKYLAQGNMSPATYGTMSSIEFVTVHYTGNMSKGANAEANASYFVNAKDVSIHYATGNDGVFYCLDETKGGWHAGDSGALSLVGEFKWMPTGVKVQEQDPKYPVFTISQDFYYEINGFKTTVKMPEPWDYQKRGTDHILNEDGTISANPRYGDDFKGRTPESFINDQGLPFKIVDGEYYMGTTWWCYTQVYEGRICSTGGNRNSVGIESCVDEGSDLWWTWQKTAQLVANIMYDHDLDITRVRGHHFFAAKDCPQPMLENDLEIWWEFIELVEAEYELLTVYKGYSVSIKSDNPEIVDDCGRVIAQPLNPTCVTYTITFTKGNTVKSIKLASMIQGACVDR